MAFGPFFFLEIEIVYGLFAIRIVSTDLAHVSILKENLLYIPNNEFKLLIIVT